MNGRECSCKQSGFRARRQARIHQPVAAQRGLNSFVFESEPFEFEAENFEAENDEWELTDEWSLNEWESLVDEVPPTKAATSGSTKPCPVKSPGPAKDRCTKPGTLACPALPDLLCVSGLGSIPFEYPTSIKRGSGGLYVVKSRKTVTQRYIPLVGLALSQFIVNCAAFQMPVEAILTAGSLYCRCISNTNTLSNHSFGDAMDVVGIRWRSPQGMRETIVHNYANPGERAILQRINACLRLSFATVIDYHRSDHRDHFHCDMNRARGRSPKGKTTVVFVQEALNKLLGAGLPEDGRLGTKTLQALSSFSGRSVADLGNDGVLNKALNELFIRITRG